jgi:beta-lactamase class A
MAVIAAPLAASGWLRAEEKKAPTLEDRLRPLIAAHKGDVAIAVKHLGNGESFAHRADEPMPTASLIKLAVMIEAYQQAEAKRIDLKDPVTLKESDKVPGSGILTYHFSPGASFPLRDAVRLMIVYSDNTATNLVLDKIGIASTGETMESLGCPHTKIYAKVFKRKESSIDLKKSERFGLGSTTANEMIRLCEGLHKGEFVGRSACDAMLDHLRACDDKDKFPRFLPPGTKIAFKTGSVDDIRTAAGILDTPSGPVALCVLTEHNADQRYDPDNAGNRLCADIARAVYDHFDAPKTKADANGNEKGKP